LGELTFSYFIISTGDHQIRFQSSGNKLPGPRELQLAISTISPNIIDVPEITNVHFTQMGQWLAHDITLMSPDLSGKYNSDTKLVI
jgi:hypothetical protein